MLKNVPDNTNFCQETYLKKNYYLKLKRASPKYHLLLKKMSMSAVVKFTIPAKIDHSVNKVTY